MELESHNLTVDEMKDWLSHKILSIKRNGQEVPLCPPPDYGRPRQEKEESTATEAGLAACEGSVVVDDELFDDPAEEFLAS